MHNRIKLLPIVALLLASLSFVATGQTPDLSGAWAGTFSTANAQGGIELTFTREGSSWTAVAKMRLQGQEISPPVQSLSVEQNKVEVSLLVAGRVVKLMGTVEADTVSGPIEVRQNDQITAGTFSIKRGGEMPPLTANPGQMADPNFNSKVEKPAYKKNGPRVLFDEAHYNFHTATGRYKPFADLITSDGYQITPGRLKFTLESLKDYDVLIISNALGAAAMGAPEASQPAFTAEESDAVREWVRKGGALLLIADHAPMGSANQILGERFGIDMSKKYTMDSENFDKASGNQGFIVYTRESGRLVDHPITKGKKKEERISKVIAFTGQSLKGPADSVAFMKLAESAQDVMQGETPVSAAGRAQGIALKFGKGRVIVMGEAGMLTAQVTGAQRSPFGMNIPGIDNRQLVLNMLHWLTKKL